MSARSIGLWMVRTRSILAIVFVLISVVALSDVSLASIDVHVLEPGVPYEVTEQSDSMAYINYSWTVNPPDAMIRFVVLHPDGSVLVDTNASSYDGFLLSLESGDYTFRWTSNESSPVSLTYDIVSQSTGIDDDEHIFDTVFLGLLVGAVVVVIIIVLVSVVVVRGGRKTLPPVVGRPSQHAPPGEKPSPYVPGMCPRCGSPFDSQHTFCPKCGHRVR